MDKLGSMMLGAPTFKDKTGYFPGKNIDTTFFALNEGLLAIRKTLGEERYATLRALSDKAGREIIHEMEDILKSAAERRASK